MPGCASWRAERFTLTGGPPAWGVSACVQASISAQRPSGTIRPVSSATGMNSAGETAPRTGCRQRISASSASVSPVAMSTTGW